MRDFAALLRDRRFVLLWLAMLASATGTFALLVAVSAHVLRSSGSGLAAAAVFASQWLLPVVLAPWVRRVCETRDLRRAVIACELASAVTSVGVAVFLRADSLAAVLLCFAVRGLFEAMTKTARVVFVRLMFEGPRLAAAAYTFNLSYYAGITLGGLAASVLTSAVPLEVICMIDALTFVISAACYALLPQVHTPASGKATQGVWRDAWAILSRNKPLMASVGYLVIATGCFQGFHNAARTLLPIRHLGFTDAVAMQLQGVSGTAIVFGALAAPLLAGFARWRGFAHAVFALACAAIMATAFVRTPMQLFAVYFAFMFLFELSFTVGEAKLIQGAGADEIATLWGASGSAGTAMLVVTALLTGALADAIAFQWVCMTVACIALGLAMALWVLQRPPRTAGVTGAAKAPLGVIATARSAE